MYNEVSLLLDNVKDRGCLARLGQKAYLKKNNNNNAVIKQIKYSAKNELF